MTDEALRKEAQELIRRVINAQSNQLSVLAKEADLDSSQDFVGMNFAGYDFSGDNLEGFNLSGANFCRAVLRRTKLSKAILERADLSYAELDNADLRNADLKFAILKFTRLNGANLTGANLEDADFEQAYLENANLTTTNAIRTKFRSTKLTGTCLDDWRIDSTTQLDGVECSHFYLRQNKKVQYSSRENLPVGDFIKFYTKIAQIIQLLITSDFQEVRDPVRKAGKIVKATIEELSNAAKLVDAYGKLSSILTKWFGG
jgi:uncharacterized protein YjbI with pentapeptide repeats